MPPVGRAWLRPRAQKHKKRYSFIKLINPNEVALTFAAFKILYKMKNLSLIFASATILTACGGGEPKADGESGSTKWESRIHYDQIGRAHV